MKDDDILKSNGYEGACAKRKNDVKTVLNEYDTMDENTQNELKKFGIEVTKAAKHYRLKYYGVGKYSFTASSTPSDKNAGKRIAADIIKKLF